MIERDFFQTTLSELEIKNMNPLALAHVGDAVYELMMRVYLTGTGSRNGSLHQATVKMVNAAAQAEAMRRIAPLLSEEEKAIFLRGRNARVNSVPRHAALADYHAATGLETLFGCLYLLGRQERLNILFAAILEV